MKPRGPTHDEAHAPDTADLGRVLQALLRPLARLLVARGATFPIAQAALKEALVEAAAQVHDDLPAHRRVSRISTTLGLNRREVTRLTSTRASAPAPRPSLATEVFLRWRSDPAWRTSRGVPRTLARAGPGPSFETLARSVTQDVHPRSLLDELCRLGLARLEDDEQRVSLVADAFVPRGDARRMLAFLADNVGDHLSAAVANVLGDGRQHFEQAIFADDLSAESMQAVRAIVTREWNRLLEAMVPELEALIEQDRQAARVQDHRLRIGLYTYDTQVAPATPVESPEHAGDTGPVPRPRSRTRKKDVP